MRRRELLASIVATMALSACREPRGPEAVRTVEPGPDPGFKPPEGFSRLVLASTPYLDPEILRRSHEPLAEFLSSHLRVPVQVVRTETYAEVGERMKSGEVDLGSFSPLAYVRARAADETLVPVVNFIADGSATSAGYIVTRAEGPIRSIEDLRGKSFAFVDPSSTTGYLYPLALLRSKSIQPDAFFSKAAFLGNHEAALLAVHEERFDAAAIFQGALPALHRNHGIDPLSFRIIAKTQRTPKDIFCARQSLPQDVLQQIRRALLSLSVRTPEGRRILAPLNVNGFIPADDRMYDEVRAVEAQLADDPG